MNYNYDEACQVKVDEEVDRNFLTPEEGLNVALAENGAKMVKPGMADHALNGDLGTFTSHEIRGIWKPWARSQEGIVIELQCNYMLNRIKILLLDDNGRSYSYYLEVSMDGITWTRICDYTKYLCRSWQFIQFPKSIVRFIKIVGTYSSVSYYPFEVVSIQAYLARRDAEDDFEIYRKWNPLCLLVPKVNVATLNFGAHVSQGLGGSQHYPSDDMINGNLSRHLCKNYTYNSIGNYRAPIVLQLSQPFVLDSMRFLLWDGDDRVYSYEVKVSTDMAKWTTIAIKQHERSWQYLTFDRVPVTFVQILGTYNSKNDQFHVIHFECPAQTAEGPEVEA